MQRLILLFLFWLITSPLFGFALLDVDEVSLDAYKIADHRDAYTYEYKDRWYRGTSFNLNLCMLEIFFLENKINILGTESQVREGSWQYRLGVELGKHLQLYWAHWSRHLLEDENPNYRFPLDNFYGVRFYFLRK